MRRMRKLYFKKTIKMLDNFNYSCLNDIYIIEFLLSKFKINQIKYKIDDFEESWIKVKTTRLEYENFVKEFINKFGKKIDHLRF